MLLRLYLVFTDEIAFLLAGQEGEERLTAELVGRLTVYRAAIERFLLAPFGSVVIFEALELQILAQNALRERDRKQAAAEPAEVETP